MISRLRSLAGEISPRGPPTDQAASGVDPVQAGLEIYRLQEGVTAAHALKERLEASGLEETGQDDTDDVVGVLEATEEGVVGALLETLADPETPPRGRRPRAVRERPQETLDVGPYQMDLDADDLRKEVHRTLERAGVDAPTRPATSKLTHDQADLIVDLLEGFTSRREILEWQQDVVVQTLGQLDDGWHQGLLADPPTLAALLEEPVGTISAVDPAISQEIRRGIVAKDLLPAFHAAHQTFRWAAVERVDHLDDEGDGDAPDPVDPLDQAYPLMRPAFGELDGHQKEVLESLLDGFEDQNRLLLWITRVIGASYAEIDQATVESAYFEAPLKDHLLNPADGRDRFVRESWAAEFLLPAFNRSAAELAQRSQEVTASGGPSHYSGPGSIS